MYLLVILFAEVMINVHGGMVEVINFVDDAGGGQNADNIAAWKNATAQQAVTGLPIYVPAGTYRFGGQINGTNVKLYGVANGASAFTMESMLGFGVPFMDLYGNDSWIRDMTIFADVPCYSNSLGNYCSNTDGVRLNGPIEMSNVAISRFYSCVVLNSPVGHTFTNYANYVCYYGMYVLHSGGNNLVQFSGLGGSMASVGVASTSYLDYGDYFYRTHVCFSPYGFYQEGPAPVSAGVQMFMQGVQLQLTRFESCGMAGIFSHNSNTSARGLIKDTKIFEQGFFFNSMYSIAGGSSSYGLAVGSVQGEVLYLPWNSADPGFYGTTYNLIFIQNATSSNIFTYNLIQGVNTSDLLPLP